MAKPETIENRWDILYREYPEVYEEWGQIPKHPTAVQELNRLFPLAGKKVLDVGSGSGLSTFELAQYAGFVIGIEPEESMSAIAAAAQLRQSIANIRFLRGSAEALPLADRSVDMAVAITLASIEIARDAAEMERVTKPGGLVLRADISPGWYCGELNPVITGLSRDETPVKGSRDDILPSLGYDYLDFFMDQDYGTVDKVIRTYGFIHGSRAIEYIKEKRITTIRWRSRIHYKRIPV